MRRFLVGGVLGAAALLTVGAVSGRQPNPLGALLGSMLACWLVLQAGPRSIVERWALVMTGALACWAAGTGTASFLDALIGWGLAALAIAAALRPRAE